QSLRIAMTEAVDLAGAVVQMNDEGLAVGNVGLLGEHPLGLDAGEVVIAEREHQSVIAEEPQSPANLHAGEGIVLVDAVLAAQRYTRGRFEHGVPVELGISREEGRARAGHRGYAHHEALLLALPEVV